MAVLNTTHPTLVDLGNLPGAKDGELISMLGQFNPMLQDAPAIQCNKDTYHETYSDTSLPTVAWGAVNQGIGASKGTNQKVSDTTGFVQSASQIHQPIIDNWQDAMMKASIRMDQAKKHMEAIAQELATALIYHDTRTDAKKPLGLAPRYNSLSAENGGQIIDGEGVGSDNCSIWLVTWDESTAHVIYPKSTSAGLKRTDRGLVPVADPNDSSRTMFCYREEFEQHIGLCVRDWRYIVRGANIDVSDLTTDASVGANIIQVLTEMWYKWYGRLVPKGKSCLYMPTTLVKFLDYQARSSGNADKLFLAYKETMLNSGPVLTYRGIPIKESHALTLTEAAVA